MDYFYWNQETISDHSPENISRMYQNGYVFTRLGRGVMQQTRSVRINLGKFTISSENRRILKKGENINLQHSSIPYFQYSWKIAKMARDFYVMKARGAFSTNKIKQLITTSHNFNKLYSFDNIGYVIVYENNHMVHYCYPFYDIDSAPKDMGLIMMTKAIIDAKDRKLSYIYLGSLQRPKDIYKLQFSGIEWFDGNFWRQDIEQAKKSINQIDYPKHDEQIT